LAAETPDTTRDARAEDRGQPGTAHTMTDDKTNHWYIIHSYSGFEYKVRESLELRVLAYGLTDDIV
jgi:hypothetical protein